MKNLKDKLDDHIYKNEFTEKLLRAEEHFLNILKHCDNQFEIGTGSYLFEGIDYEYSIEMYPKQKLLYEKSKKAKEILEIGTYMGHSILIMLLANPNAKITSIDINDRYSLPAINYLKEKFPMAEINFLKGSSLDILPTLNKKYDFFHIDGSHLNHIIVKEFNLCRKISNNNIFNVIFDDIDSCVKLKKNIINSFKKIDIFEPICKWNNCHMLIQLSNEDRINEKENLIFNRLNRLDFIKDYLKIFFKNIRRLPKKAIKGISLYFKNL